jgi:heat shock protein HtpX
MVGLMQEVKEHGGMVIVHATNGDMVTMTLIQGVVNTFVFIASVIITNALRGDRDRDREGGFADFFMHQLVFNLVNMVLGLLAFVLIIGPFSRLREFRADAGGAALAGKAKMIAGLQALQDTYRLSQAQPAPPSDPSLATLMVTTSRKSWFSTHPSLEDRIARLQALR